LSNNPATSFTYSKQKAENQVAKYGDKDKSKAGLASLLSAQRLAGRDANEGFNTARRIAALEVEKKIDSDLDDAVKLDLALTAMGDRKFAMAEHFFNQIITKGKSAAFKAAAYNAMGVIALNDDRVPEAVAFFRQALKLDDGYKAARLNLGLTALKGGDFDLAKRMLGDLQDDWFVKASLISVARLEGNTSQVESICKSVLGDHPKHKPTVFNCALHEFQGKRDYTAARELANKMVKIDGGSQGWDDQAYKLLERIELAVVQDKRKKDQEIADKKRQEDEKKRQDEAAKQKAISEKNNQPKAPEKIPASDPPPDKGAAPKAPGAKPGAK
jgi:tetratricopeptide (TPR) repeat protein